MPTKNPRLSVVLSPSLAATLAALSEATGDSASSLVRGLLEQTEPALQRMTQLVVAAKAAPSQIGSGMSESMDRVINDLEDALAVADARTKRVHRDLVSAAETVRGRRRSATAGAAGRGASPAPDVGLTPVPVTRGSGGGKTLSKGVRRGSV
jgi:predicted DNA-binding protein